MADKGMHLCNGPKHEPIVYFRENVDFRNYCPGCWYEEKISRLEEEIEGLKNDLLDAAAGVPGEAPPLSAPASPSTRERKGRCFSASRAEKK